MRTINFLPAFVYNFVVFIQLVIFKEQLNREVFYLIISKIDYYNWSTNPNFTF